MKTMMKKTLALLLVVCTLISVCPMNVLATDEVATPVEGQETAAVETTETVEEEIVEETPAEEAALTDTSSTTIVLEQDVAQTVTMTDTEYAYCSFTPEKDGYYVVLTSSAYTNESWVDISLSSDSSVPNHSYSTSIEEGMFYSEMTLKMTAGETYTFSVWCTAESFDVVAFEEAIELGAGDYYDCMSVCLDETATFTPHVIGTREDGTEVHISPWFYSEDVSSYSVALVSGDEYISMAESTEDGWLQYTVTGVAAGTATIEVEVTYCGQTFTQRFDVTVEQDPLETAVEITEGTASDVIVADNYGYFKFTPAETGYYAVEATSTSSEFAPIFLNAVNLQDSQSYGYVNNDGYYVGAGTYSLTEGETYLFRAQATYNFNVLIEKETGVISAENASTSVMLYEKSRFWPIALLTRGDEEVHVWESYFPEDVSTATVTVSEGADCITVENDEWDNWYITGLEAGTATVKIVLTFCGQTVEYTYTVVVSEYSIAVSNITNFETTMYVGDTITPEVVVSKRSGTVEEPVDTPVTDVEFTYTYDVDGWFENDDGERVTALSVDDNGVYTAKYPGEGCLVITAKQNDVEVASTAAIVIVEERPITEVATGDCGENLTWVLTSDGTLTISGDGTMDSYSEGTEPWADHVDIITAVVVEDGVDGLGKGAYDVLTDTYHSAFANCTNLVSVEIGNSLQSLYEGTFTGSESLNYASFENPFTDIKAYSVGFHASEETSVGYAANDDVTICGYDDSTAEAYAYENGFTFESLGAYDVNGTDDGITWALSGGVLTISGSGAIPDKYSPWAAYKTKIKELVIEEGITAIGEYAFQYCSALETVSFPDSLTEIGAYAFLECGSLGYVEIPEMTAIEASTFQECVSLELVIVSAGTESIGSMAFGVTKEAYVDGEMVSCGSLSEVVLPDSITTIEPDAFWGNTNATVHYCTEGSVAYNFAVANSMAMEQHYWDEGVITKHSTTTEPGEKTYTCAVCGGTKTEELPVNSLYLVDGVWGYYVDGEIQTSYTGLVKYKGAWFFVDKGYVNWTYTGLVKYSGAFFYVTGGKVQWSYTGLVQYNGTWFYVQGGQLKWGYTGLVLHTNKVWYYVVNSQVKWGYTGLVLHTNKVWYYVKNGQINWSYNGLVLHTNKVWYYVKNGQINWSYTGLVPYNGALYYVTSGQIKWSYSGTCVYNGKTYTVVGGIAKT